MNTFLIVVFLQFGIWGEVEFGALHVDTVFYPEIICEQFTDFLNEVEENRYVNSETGAYLDTFAYFDKRFECQGYNAEGELVFIHPKLEDEWGAPLLRPGS